MNRRRGLQPVTNIQPDCGNIPENSPITKKKRKQKWKEVNTDALGMGEEEEERWSFLIEINYVEGEDVRKGYTRSTGTCMALAGVRPF